MIKWTIIAHNNVLSLAQSDVYHKYYEKVYLRWLEKYNIMKVCNQAHWWGWLCTICFDFAFLLYIWLTLYEYDVNNVREYNSHKKRYHKM